MKPLTRNLASAVVIAVAVTFPPSHRARIVAGFMAAIPVSIGLGAPISTSLLDSMASSGSLGGDGCSSARRHPR
jgi:hypothetical protein